MNKKLCSICKKELDISFFKRRSTEDGVIYNDFEVCNLCILKDAFSYEIKRAIQILKDSGFKGDEKMIKKVIYDNWDKKLRG